MVFGVSQVTVGIDAEYGEGSAFGHGRRRLNRASHLRAQQDAAATASTSSP
jgi:hypothetical protein